MLIIHTFSRLGLSDSGKIPPHSDSLMKTDPWDAKFLIIFKTTHFTAERQLDLV